ncbi:hypothetical protein DDZ18_09765 [Marinicauda salina]|uniref:DUF3450 domain-containing protein n=1 Tax=Marinicauda salina TaxID=2135793 RepID=A0A2U2BSJ3_9PROT|nr:DUF3450 domain-containing protein [Marinicauda salina]PWE16983.1 hypothetical protein DDZ18_09765 [Marinicauda salina]
MSKTLYWIRSSLAAGAAAAAIAGASGAQQLDQALQVAQQSTEEGAQAQEQIDAVADRADNLEREYLALREQIESQRVYLEQQRVFLQSQENELTELERQLERVQTIERDLTPMLLEMYVRLEEFVDQDLPFQMEQRRNRLADIEEVLGEANVSPAEKYRLILNAFEIESSYGRSLRAYGEEVEIDGVPREADILQIGRVALIRRIGGDYQILTKDNPEWRDVPGGATAGLQRAYRIAEEVTTPEVFVAPLPGPQQAQ